MQLKDLTVFKCESFILCYGDLCSYFATESFETDSDWYEEIISRYGEVQIESIKTLHSPYRVEIMVVISKEKCFEISYEIMDTIMVEDESRKEIA